jgi:hypothetical protein
MQAGGAPDRVVWINAVWLFTRSILDGCTDRSPPQSQDQSQLAKVLVQALLGFCKILQPTIGAMVRSDNRNGISSFAWS